MWSGPTAGLRSVTVPDGIHMRPNTPGSRRAEVFGKWAFPYERDSGRGAFPEGRLSPLPGLRPLEHHLSGHEGGRQHGEWVSPIHFGRPAHARGGGDPPGHGPRQGTEDETGPFRMAVSHCGRESPVARWERLDTLGRAVRTFRLLMPHGVVRAHLGDHH